MKVMKAAVSPDRKNIISSDPALCGTCPRNCAAVSIGYCRGSGMLEAASVCIHRGEEPPLSGKNGICNIFFARCNMSCVYCQNYQISSRNMTQPLLDSDQVYQKIFESIEAGAEAVGFVAPSHVIKNMIQIIEQVKKRSPETLFIMNTNAYDKPETIRALEGLIDIYLPDFKYSDPALAAEYSDAPDYPQAAIRAIAEMKRQKGVQLVWDEQGERVLSGLVIRHLILPGNIDNTVRALEMIAEDISNRVHVSLMSQYMPVPATADHPLLGRRIYPHEYESALLAMDSLGFTRGWTQELSSPECYTPNFNREHPFE